MKITIQTNLRDAVNSWGETPLHPSLEIKVTNWLKKLGWEPITAEGRLAELDSGDKRLFFINQPVKEAAIKWNEKRIMEEMEGWEHVSIEAELEIPDWLEFTICDDGTRAFTLPLM
jgi:hypothetical protein